MAGEVFGIRQNLGKIIRRFRLTERRAVSISQEYPVWPEPTSTAENVTADPQSLELLTPAPIVSVENSGHQLEERAVETDWPPLRGDHTIDQVWSAHPGVAKIFAAYELENCPSCAVRFDESLSEACERYEIPESELLSKLNQLFTEQS